MTEEDSLARVHRDLVGIHASMAEATRDDADAFPWATHEIMGVIRYLSAARKAQTSKDMAAHVDAPIDGRQAPATSDGEMLDCVYRELVQIHMSVAGWTNDDKDIVPWTERELRGLVRDVGAIRNRRPASTGQSE